MKKKSKLISFSWGKSKMYVCTPLIPARDMHKDTMHGPGRCWGLKHDNSFPIHIYRIEWLQKLDHSVDCCPLWKKRLEVTSALLQQHKCFICECTSSAEMCSAFQMPNEQAVLCAPSWRTKNIQIPKQDFVLSNQAPISSGSDMRLYCVLINTSDQ